MRGEFARYLVNRYPSIKAKFPGKGRRQWLLLTLQELWDNLSLMTAQHLVPEVDLEHIQEDEDPFDHVTESGELGILIRTDFSNEDAWNTFTSRLEESERDLSHSLHTSSSQPNEHPGSDTSHAALDQTDGHNSDESMPDHVIKVFNPATDAERRLVEGITNITTLRLFNDVDLRPTPPRAAGVKHTSTPHPLVDLGGWQEIYTGPDMWVYDTLSNTDGCARAVSQQSDFYGTATGDSWRAKASFLPELQFNRSCLGMKIDFGGLDRWDLGERQRNLMEPYSLKPGEPNK